MKELELKHLAPYLPYGLKRHCPSSNVLIHDYMPLDFIQSTIGLHSKFGWKPILRPLYDLSKDDLIDAGFNSHIDYLTHELQNKDNETRLGSDGKKLWRIEAAPYEMVVFLFKNHYDVFGLIEHGLAIDINAL